MSGWFDEDFVFQVPPFGKKCDEQDEITQKIMNVDFSNETFSHFIIHGNKEQLIELSRTIGVALSVGSGEAELLHEDSRGYKICVGLVKK